MTPLEAARIAAAVSVIRPDWPEQSLRTLVSDTESLRRRPYRDVLVALAYVAADPDTRTPARVLAAGPWWQIGNPEPVPATYDRCPRCGDTYHPGVGHTAPDDCRPPAAAEHTMWAEQALRTIREAKADLCPCGVDPANCRVDHRQSAPA